MAIFTSSTRDIPGAAALPRHVAIIMDGNGRWARKRYLPRFAGHRRGVETVRDTVKYCLERGIDYLTLFAFSSENWRRPEEEVTLLMQLFARALQQEVSRLDRNGVRLRVVGDLSRFDPDLQSLILASEQQTAGNEKLTLTIAANYGGRWDILQAVNRMAMEHPEKQGAWSEADLAPYLAMNYAPEPDLFIRTGGEARGYQPRDHRRSVGGQGKPVGAGEVIGSEQPVVEAAGRPVARDQQEGDGSNQHAEAGHPRR